MRDVVTLLMPITPTRWKENINSRTNHLFSEAASKPDASVIQLLTIIKLNRTHRLLSISLKLLAQYLLAVNDVPSSSCEASFNGSRVIRPPKRIIPSDAKKYAVKQSSTKTLDAAGIISAGIAPKTRNLSIANSKRPTRSTLAVAIN
jgi:hypothetical protein